MKIELPVAPPAHLKEQWEGQFSLFSHYVFTIDVPAPAFVITTLKPNGLANAALSAWGMMAGSGREPKFLLQVHNYTESRKLIEQNGEFVISYLSLPFARQMRNTVDRYDDATDELLASGLSHEPAVVVRPPRVAEAFASLECRVEWLRDVETEHKVSTLVQAAIVHACLEESAACDTLKEAHGRRQWAMHISETINPVTGAFDGGVLAAPDLEKAVNLAELW